MEGAGIHPGVAYSYNPLSSPTSIRIFELLPSEDGGTIEGRLFERYLQPSSDSPLEDRPLRDEALNSENSYEALSYRWGDPKTTQTINCDGKVLQINRNLYSALLRLRPTPKHGPRPIWTDQICINQEDLQERGSQVMLMGEIFQLARRVVIFLGDDDSDISAAVQLAQKLAKKGLSTQITNRSTFGLVPSQNNDNEISAELPNYRSAHDDQENTPEDDAWRSWRGFFSREWFGRTWMLQEYILATGDLEVICGAYRLDLGTFFQACQAATHLKIASAFTCAPVDKHRQDVVTRGIECLRTMQELIEPYRLGAKFDLLTMLRVSRDTQATDPRDKMFAVLSLARNCNSPDLRPDYSVSLEEVSRRYARYIVRSYGRRSPDMLYDCDWDEDIWSSERLTMPSWVPDWNRQLNGAHVDWQIKKSLAGGENEPIMRLQDNPDLLGIRGRCVGIVASTGQSIRNDFVKHITPAYKEYGVFFEAMVLVTMVTPYPTGETTWETFWRSLTADKPWSTTFFGDGKKAESAVQLMVVECLRSALYTNDSQDKEVLEHFIKTIVAVGMHASNDIWAKIEAGNQAEAEEHRNTAMAILQLIGFKPSMIFEEPDESTLKTARQYKEACLLSCKSGRTCCVTNNGYFGICPAATRRGDSIFVFDGVHTPWVLRPEGNHFLLVGSCYVHGIMHGEAYVNNSTFLSEDIILK